MLRSLVELQASSLLDPPLLYEWRRNGAWAGGHDASITMNPLPLALRQQLDGQWLAVAPSLVRRNNARLQCKVASCIVRLAAQCLLPKLCSRRRGVWYKHLKATRLQPPLSILSVSMAMAMACAFKEGSHEMTHPTTLRYHLATHIALSAYQIPTYNCDSQSTLSNNRCLSPQSNSSTPENGGRGVPTRVRKNATPELKYPFTPYALKLAVCDSRY